jgi:hypothetical protein
VKLSCESFPGHTSNGQPALHTTGISTGRAPLAVESSDFLYLQHETAMNKGTLSSHISRLEREGYVSIEKTFRGKVPQNLLRLTRVGRNSFEQYRKTLKKSL